MFIKLVLPRHFLLKCLYQARKVGRYLCVTSCICVLGLSILSVSTIFLLDFGIVPTMWSFFFFFFHFIISMYLGYEVTTRKAYKDI